MATITEGTVERFIDAYKDVAVTEGGNYPKVFFEEIRKGRSRYVNASNIPGIENTVDSQLFIIDRIGDSREFALKITPQVSNIKLFATENVRIEGGGIKVPIGEGFMFQYNGENLVLRYVIDEEITGEVTQETPKVFIAKVPHSLHNAMIRGLRSATKYVSTVFHSWDCLYGRDKDQRFHTDNARMMTIIEGGYESRAKDALVAGLEG